MFKSNARVFSVAKSSTGKHTFVTSDIVSQHEEKVEPKAGTPKSSEGYVVSKSAKTVTKQGDLPKAGQEKVEPFKVGGTKERRAIETSATETADNSSNPRGNVGAMSDIESSTYYEEVLSGFIATDPSENAATSISLNRIYRDIYHSDPVCGNAVELMSTMPWSEFDLTGVKDSKKMDLYVNSCERMRIQTLLPSASIEYNVIGAWCGSLSFNAKDKIFDAITPQNLDFVDILPVPVFGVDPLLTLRLPPEIAKFLKSEDPRVKEFEHLIPEDLLEARSKIEGNGSSRGGLTIPLSADRTIFIPRKGMLKDFRGTSMYRRVLVPWLIEKALMRGTTDQVYKRQRAISHVTAGDEEWKPSNEEMAAIANLFMTADLDPVGSIVVTRNGISVSDIREGGNFWRWDQSHADLATIKYQAMGISEGFVTGEFNASTVDATLSSFMEQIRSFRAMMTQEIFYEKTFPLISKENGITIKKYGTSVETAAEMAMVNRPGARLISQQGNTKIYRNYEGELVAEVASGRSNVPGMFDIDQFVVPEVHWHKRLMPEYDSAYLEMLFSLEEKGVPIPIRLLAAAGGMNMQNLLDSKSDDLKIRGAFGDWIKEIKDINKDSGLTPDEEGGEFASFVRGNSSLRPRGLGSRKVADPDSPLLVIPNLDSQGKPRFQTASMKKNAIDRIHKFAAKTMAELAKKENAKPDNHKRTKEYSHSK